MRAVTQTDVAKATGVSQRAVASVIGTGSSNGARVSAQTRQRILEAAARLNYKPHKQAQLMRGVKSGTIGVLKRSGNTPDDVERVFHINRAITDAGYAVIASDYLGDDSFENATDILVNTGVEGILLIGGGDKSKAGTLRQLRIPVATLAWNEASPFPGVAADHARGMQDIVQHLVAQGMSRLLYGCPGFTAAGHPFHGAYRQQLAGFHQGASNAGITATSTVVTLPARDPHPEKGPVDVGNHLDDFMNGERLAHAVLECDTLPHALLCYNDRSALAAIRKLSEEGVRVPIDMALTGFGGDIIGAYATPTLTTVCQPVQEMAHHAITLLTRRIRGEQIDADLALAPIAGELLIRESSLRTVVP